jgi:antitoxin VapB
MGLTIDNEAVLAMIRDLAERRGVSPDEAVRDAVERAVAQTPPAPRERTPEEVEERYQALMAIARRAHALPVISDMTEDEILGYDENGIPTR